MKKITLVVLCVFCLVAITVALAACDVPSSVRGRYTGYNGVFGATSDTNWYVSKNKVYTTGAWLQYTYGGGSIYRVESNSSRASAIRDIAPDTTVLLGDFIRMRPEVNSVDAGHSDINCSQRIKYNLNLNQISVENNVIDPMGGYSYTLGINKMLFVDGTECLKVS